MTPAILQARAAGIRFAVHELEGAHRADFGERAVRALGVPGERVFKTLVAQLDEARLVVAMVPVVAQLDLKRLAVVEGAKRAELAPSRDAERATGYVLGGISPLGQRRRLPAYLDDSALGFETVFVSAGRRGLELELAPKDLLAVSGARPAAIARGPGGD